MAEGDQLMEQLSNFLNSSEGMAQLQSAAQMLGLGPQSGSPPGQGGPAGQSASGMTSHPAPAGGGMDLGAMLSSLKMPAQGGGQSTPAVGDGGPGMDPQAVFKVMKLMQAANRETPSSGLLRALKPLLREERRGRVDEAIRMMQLFSLLPLLKEGMGP